MCYSQGHHQRPAFLILAVVRVGLPYELSLGVVSLGIREPEGLKQPPVLFEIFLCIRISNATDCEETTSAYLGLNLPPLADLSLADKTTYPSWRHISCTRATIRVI